MIIYLQPQGIAVTSPPIPSWYAASAHARPSRPPLRGETACDVVVVGAGFTGLTAALGLAEKGFKVTVIDREQVGFGASGRSGGQLIAGFNRSLGEMAGLVGEADARQLWDLSEAAMGLTRTLIANHTIDCDWRDGHIHVGVKPRHARELATMAEEWTRLGRRDLTLWDTATTRQQIASPLYTSALRDPHAGHLHPLNYTLGLARAAEAAGAVIHEHTPMTDWQRPGSDHVVVNTPRGGVRAKWLVLAGNAYLWRAERRLGRHIMPVGTYIVATEPLGEARLKALIKGGEAVADINFVLNYYRPSSDHRLLFGGRVSYSGVDPSDIADSLRRVMLGVFPSLADVKITHAWGGQVAITVNRLPHVGRLDNNVLFAHGYSGHGVALAPFAGSLIAEAIAGQAGRFDVMARIPHGPFPGGTALRTPLLLLASTWYKLMDRL